MSETPAVVETVQRTQAGTGTESGSAEHRGPVGHHRLVVWQRGMELVEECYRLTRAFPAEERYGLASQIRRAAISVPANIAEGYGRGRARQFTQFLDIARGSTRELQTLLEAAARTGCVSRDQLTYAMGLADECARMAGALVTRYRR